MDTHEDDPEAGRRRTIWADIDRVVAREDPEGLLAMGAPEDEYRPEVDDLTSLVLSDVVDAEAVLDLWERWFGPRCGLVRSAACLGRLTAALTDLQHRHSLPGPRTPSR